jgi:hypothetical protein
LLHNATTIIDCLTSLCAILQKHWEGRLA